jgi:hypothetical protein
VKIDLDTLLTGLDGIGSAGLDGGIAITAGQARRMDLPPAHVTGALIREQIRSVTEPPLSPSAVPRDGWGDLRGVKARRGAARPPRPGRALAATRRAQSRRAPQTAGAPTDNARRRRPTTPASTSAEDPTANGPSTAAREGDRVS